MSENRMKFRHSIDYTKDGDRPVARWYRAYWFGSDDDTRTASAQVLFWHAKQGHGIGFQFGVNGSESDIGLDLHLGRLFSAWLRLRTPWTARFRRPDDYNAYHYGFKIRPYDGAWFTFDINAKEHHYSSRDPWWTSFTMNKNKVFGKNRIGPKETLRVEACKIPLTEGSYDGIWTLERSSTFYTYPLGRLRDRILGPRTHLTGSLDIPGGIPVEGKGENSYDCGMDGLFGVSGDTPQAAIGHAVSSVLRDRQRYGGPHSLPHPMTVTEARRECG